MLAASKSEDVLSRQRFRGSWGLVWGPYVILSGLMKSRKHPSSCHKGPMAGGGPDFLNDLQYKSLKTILRPPSAILPTVQVQSEIPKEPRLGSASPLQDPWDPERYCRLPKIGTWIWDVLKGCSFVSRLWGWRTKSYSNFLASTVGSIKASFWPYWEPTLSA